MTNTRTSVAVLDDEPKFRSAIRRLLRANGCDVKVYATCEEFMAAARQRRPDCLLLDLHMPQIDGFAVLQSMSERRMDVPVIVITGHDDPGNAERVQALGASAYLLKPVNRATLLDAIGKACPKGRMPTDSGPGEGCQLHPEGRAWPANQSNPRHPGDE